MKKIIWIIIFLIGCIFVFAGAVNAGFSRYFMAIPFMLLILLISNLILKNQELFYFSIFFIVLSILINYTQKINPFLFPIVHDGYVTILKDGYQRTWEDGSGGFTESNERKTSDDSIVTYTKVNKGDRYAVKRVDIHNPEFAEEFAVVTEIGELGNYDFQGIDSHYKEPLQLNKPVRSKWAAELSMLMDWPSWLFFWQ